MAIPSQHLNLFHEQRAVAMSNEWEYMANQTEILTGMFCGSQSSCKWHPRASDFLKECVLSPAVNALKPSICCWEVKTTVATPSRSRGKTRVTQAARGRPSTQTQAVARWGAALEERTLERANTAKDASIVVCNASNSHMTCCNVMSGTVGSTD